MKPHGTGRTNRLLTGRCAPPPILPPPKKTPKRTTITSNVIMLILDIHHLFPIDDCHVLCRGETNVPSCDYLSRSGKEWDIGHLYSKNKISHLLGPIRSSSRDLRHERTGSEQYFRLSWLLGRIGYPLVDTVIIHFLIY